MTPLSPLRVNPKSTGLFAPGTALGGLFFTPSPLCKIRSIHPRELELSGLIAFIMPIFRKGKTVFYQASKYGETSYFRCPDEERFYSFEILALRTLKFSLFGVEAFVFMKMR